MYFRNYGLSKTWLDQYKKLPLQSTLEQATWSMDRKTVEILTEARLSYVLISVKAMEFDKVTLSGMQKLKTISSHTQCL